VRAVLLGFACLGFACRLVVPAGYMPAPLAEGAWIRVCPAGRGGEFFVPPATDHAGHAHRGEHTPADDHAGHGFSAEYCPTGSLFSTAGAVSTFALSLDHPGSAAPAEGGFAAVTAPPPLPYRSRAPPLPRSV
jgi:hypothetical protein